jgi:hypothetical protein
VFLPGCHPERGTRRELMRSVSTACLLYKFSHCVRNDMERAYLAACHPERGTRRELIRHASRVMLVVKVFSLHSK